MTYRGVPVLSYSSLSALNNFVASIMLLNKESVDMENQRLDMVSLDEEDKQPD